MQYRNYSVTSSHSKRFTLLWLRQLPAQLQADIEKALEQVPTEVAWDYNLSGGHITYQTKDLYHNGESNPYANGVYYLDSHDIYIKFSYDLEDRNRPRPELALTHELGHYMYYKTAYQWTDEMKQALDDAYQYWSKYAPEVTSKEEAFAFIYSEKCCCGPQFCDAEQVKLVQQVEQMFGVAVEG